MTTPTRKPTRKAAEKTQAALDSSQIWFQVDDGDLLVVSPVDITGLEERVIRRVTGLSFAALMDQFGTNPGLDTVAAMIWIAKWQEGEAPTTENFEAALGAVNYGSDVEIFDEKPEGAATPPEA